MLLSTAPLESVPHIVSLLSPESFCHCYPFFCQVASHYRHQGPQLVSEFFRQSWLTPAGSSFTVLQVIVQSYR